MSRRDLVKQNTHKFSVRFDNDLDADLIDWLDAQPHGKRSEAMRDLMRDGLRMRQLEGNLAGMVRQAVAEALAGVQVITSPQHTPADTDEVEDAHGDRLDQLMGRFG